MGTAVSSLSTDSGDDDVVSLASLEGAVSVVTSLPARPRRQRALRIVRWMLGGAMLGGVVLATAAAVMDHGALLRGVRLGPALTELTHRLTATVARHEPPAANPQPAVTPTPVKVATVTPTAATVAVVRPAPPPIELAATDETPSPVASDQPAELVVDDETSAAPPPPPELGRAERLERARALVNQAVYYRNAGRLRDAIKNYRSALSLHARYPLAMAGLARVYILADNGKHAVHWARRLTRVQPRRGSNHLLLGDAHALSGNTARAQAAWKQAARRGSKRAVSRLRK